MLQLFSRNFPLIIGIGSAIGVTIFGVILASKFRVLRSRKTIEIMMEALQKSSVQIKDRENVERKIQEMIRAGRKKLQVISDFDRTLSRVTKPDGSRCDTCHNALDMSKRLPEFYQQEAVKLRDTYYPIEIDPDLTISEKYPYMDEWWTKAHNLLVQCNLTRDTLHNIVAESSVILRSGCDILFQQLHKAGVPLLIFSAGIGDVIEEVVKQQATLYDSIRIVSNYMDFNTQGTLVGFQGELIHTYNKNENAIHKSNYFDTLKGRESIILMGDSLGDLRMADGCSSDANVLKIGFLNDKIDQLLPSYLDAYDIVLVSDETVDVANAIIKQIV